MGKSEGRKESFKTLLNTYIQDKNALEAHLVFILLPDIVVNLLNVHGCLSFRFH